MSKTFNRIHVYFLKTQFCDETECKKPVVSVTEIKKHKCNSNRDTLERKINKLSNILGV